MNVFPLFWLFLLTFFIDFNLKSSVICMFFNGLSYSINIY